jgi:isoleucyl-tRNA synthetase
LVVRARDKIGVRRPLQSVTVASPDAVVREAVTQFRETVCGELNVKELHVIADDSVLCKISAKPNFRTLGKRLGPKLKAVGSGLAALTTEALRQFEREGTLELEGETLGAEDVLLTREALVAGAVESQNGITVMLDTQITAELQAEGLARELINRVQSLRKTAALEVTQRIHLVLACGGALAAVGERAGLRELIARETLASQVEWLPANAAVTLPHQRADSIEGEAVMMALEVAS